MKKIIAIAALLSCSAGVACAAWLLPVSGGYTCGAAAGMTMDIKPSANVGFEYDGTATAGNGISYSIGAYHGQGSRVYGTSSTDTNIFYRPMTATPGIVTAFSEFDIPNAPESTIGVYGTGWTASK